MASKLRPMTHRSTPPDVHVSVLRRRGRGRAACAALALLLPCMAARPAAAFTAGAFSETDAHYRAGLGLLARGLHAEAAVELRAYLDGNPADSLEVSIARYALAVCASSLGRHEEAAAQLDRIPTAALGPRGSFPHAADALLLRGRTALELSDDATAIQALERLDRDHPQSELRALGESLRGEALQRAGRHAEAARVLRGAIAQWPQSPDRDRNEFLCASAEIAAGELEAADARLGDLRRRPVDPALSRSATLLHAQALHRLERWAACAAACREALAGAPASGDDIPAVLLRSALFELGDAALAADNASAARAQFAELVQVASGAERDDALLRLALCEQRSGDPTAALASLERLLGDRPTPPAEPVRLHACFERAQALLTLGRRDEAERELKTLLGDLQPDVADPPPSDTPRDSDRFVAPVLRHLASIAAAQGRTDEAAALLQELRGRLDAGAAAALDGEMGALLLASGRPDEAERALDRAIAARRASTTELDRADADPAVLADLLLRRAIAIARQGRHADAVEAFAQAEAQAEVQPESHSTSRKGDGGAPLDAALLATGRSERAAALSALGRVDDAAAELTRLLDEGPEGGPPALRAHAAIELARLDVSAQRWSQALARLALATDSLSAPALAEDRAVDALREHERYLRGVCHLRLGAADAAASALAGFEETFPHSAFASSAMLLRGEALLAAGRPQPAAETLTALVKRLDALGPGAGGPSGEGTSSTEAATTQMAAAALLRLGEARAATQQWTASEEAFTTFLTRHAQHAQWYQARFGQGWAREQQGRHDAAIEAYRDVVARHDGLTAARAQFQIGECLFAQQRLEDAVRELVKVDVLFAAPEWSAAALYEAGRCLEALGRPHEAERQYQDLRSRFPDTRWAALAQERLPALRPDALPGAAQPPTTTPST